MGHNRSQAWEEAYEKIKPEIANTKAIIEGIDFSGGFGDDVTALFLAGQEIVPIVERVSNELKTLSSEDKLELAAQATDDALKLPWYAEPFDKPAAKVLLSRIVAFMNAKAGATEAGVSFLKG